MNRHSTLVSYLEKLVWAAHRQLRQPGRRSTSPRRWCRSSRRTRPSSTRSVRRAARSPASAILGGLIPCNVMPEEILTDHPTALPGADRRVGQPGPLGGRQPPDARGDRALDVHRRDRRVHDRDGAPRRLRAAGDDAVREVRGDVLQLRVPAQRVPPPPPGRRRHPTARSTSRRSTPASSRPPGSSPTPTSRRCAPPPSRAGPRSPPRSPRPTAAKPALGPVAPVLLYRTLGPTLPHGAASAAALWAIAQRCALLNPTGVDGAGFGDRPRGRRAAVRRHRRPARRAS